MQAALHKPAHSPAPDFARLVCLDEAAKTLGKHPDHLSRLCRTTLRFRGLAFSLTPPDGGREQWHIDRSFDPRLRVSSDQSQAEPVGDFTGKQLDLARQRAVCVVRLRQARQCGIGRMSDLAASLVTELRRQFPALKISARSLYAWDRRYGYPGDPQNLIDARGGNRFGNETPDAWLRFRDLFLHENRLPARQCWKLVRREAAENGWTWCSYFSCSRQLNARISPQEQARHREPARYRQSLAPFIAQDPESWKAGDLWVGDHCQLNLHCRCGKNTIRPWATCWMDWRTRKIVGWVLSETPNSTTILGALRHGLLDETNHGGPGHVAIDNGKDYDAWLFHGQTKRERRARIEPGVDEPRSLGIFNALGIEAHFSIPYNPNGKSHMERWFRNLDTFAKFFDTYTGDAPDTKPDGLPDILKTPHRIPSFESVRERLKDFIAGSNACADHGIDVLSEAGMTISPNEAMARWCETRRVLADPPALDLLLMHWHKPVTVGRNGISLTINGSVLHYGQFEPALGPFKAMKKADRSPVLVAYDPHDIRAVRVYDGQWRPICTAPMNQIGGMHGDAISEKHVGDLNRRKAIYDRSLRHVREHGLAGILSNEENLAEIAAQDASERRKDAAESGRSIKIVSTPLDGKSEQIDRRAATRRELKKLASGQLDLGNYVGKKPEQGDDELRQQLDFRNYKPRRRSVMDKLILATPSRAPAQVDRRQDDPWTKANQMREAANG